MSRQSSFNLPPKAMHVFLIALASIVVSVFAQFSLKTGISSPSVQAALLGADSVRTVLTIATNKFVLLGFLLYGLGAVVWLVVLSNWEVSKAYPLVGLGFIFTLAIGAMLGEQISLPRVCGALLICVGVYMISRS